MQPTELTSSGQTATRRAGKAKLLGNRLLHRAVMQQASVATPDLQVLYRQRFIPNRRCGTGCQGYDAIAFAEQLTLARSGIELAPLRHVVDEVMAPIICAVYDSLQRWLASAAGEQHRQTPRWRRHDRLCQ